MEVVSPEDLLELEFAGVEARDSDIPSMSTLLNQLVKESGVDPEQLAKVLVSQNYMGNVLKPCTDDVDIDDDDEDDPDDLPVYAISSIVNLTSRQEPVIKDMLRFIRNQICDVKVKVEKDNEIFQKIVAGDGMPSDMVLGLLIKERMLNMPVDLLQPSLISLMDDLDLAVKKNMPYKFTHLLHWSKMYVDSGVVYAYDMEDEWFIENSIAYFNYPLRLADTVMIQKEGSTSTGVPIRRLNVFEFSKLPSFIEHLKQYIPIKH